MTHPLSRDALPHQGVSLHSRLLVREDLIGLPYISYLRFSSKPQEKGTSIDRQYGVRDSIVAHYQLVCDREMEDRGFSASKRHHEQFGQLGRLLKMVEDGEITPARPIVLTIEATDRLFRSGTFDAMDVLRQLIRKGGMILVTGDLTVWNDYSINNSMLNIKLHVEINMAREGALRLSQMALGAHAGKRKLMEALVDNPDAPKPKLAGRPPAWVIRDDGGCRLHPIHVETVRLIFRLYISGYSTNQIARKLNGEGVPILVGGPPKADHLLLEWRATKIGDLLRDDAVLGLVQPHHVVNGKRVPIGSKVKVYDAAIEADVWLKAQEMLNARGQTLRGRKGAAISNLFTGKVFCHCRGSMRVDMGGEAKKNRVRKFQCNRYVEARSCSDATRYDVPKWEPLLLDYIIAHSTIVPRQNVVPLNVNALAEVRVEMLNLQESIAIVEPKIGKSPSMAERWERMCERLDALRVKENKLAVEAQATEPSTSRHEEVWRFMKELQGPALRGDRDARERLRGLLAKIDYKIEFGGTIPGGVDLTVNDWSDSFEP
jgi:hypothetical protein